MKKLRKEEVRRKLLHLLALLIPAGIFYIPKIPGLFSHLEVYILGLLLAGSVALELARLRAPKIQELFHTFFGSMLRPEERHTTTGSTYIFGAGFLCSILFIRHPDVSFMVMSMFILGDAAAAIVGLSIGRIRIGKKTLEGSVGCFVMCLTLALGVFPYVPLLLDTWGGRLWLPIAVGAALGTSLLELIPLKIGKITINDNLFVPLVNGVLMLLFRRWL